MKIVNIIQSWDLYEYLRMSGQTDSPVRYINQHQITISPDAKS